MKLDARRVNDILTVIGIAGAVLTELLPIIPEGQAKQLIALALAFIGGIGRRGFGHEDQTVANAKAEAAVARQVIASIHPPPDANAALVESVAEALKRSVPPSIGVVQQPVPPPLPER